MHGIKKKQTKKTTEIRFLQIHVTVHLHAVFVLLTFFLTKYTSRASHKRLQTLLFSCL